MRSLADVGALVKGKQRVLVEVARLPLDSNVNHPGWDSWNDAALEKKCVRSFVRACYFAPRMSECLRILAAAAATAAATNKRTKQPVDRQTDKRTNERTLPHIFMYVLI